MPKKVTPKQVNSLIKVTGSIEGNPPFWFYPERGGVFLNVYYPRQRRRLLLDDKGKFTITVPPSKAVGNYIVEGNGVRLSIEIPDTYPVLDLNMLWELELVHEL